MTNPGGDTQLLIGKFVLEQSVLENLCGLLITQKPFPHPSFLCGWASLYL
jgi:hypothetical protein